MRFMARAIKRLDYDLYFTVRLIRHSHLALLSANPVYLLHAAALLVSGRGNAVSAAISALLLCRSTLWMPSCDAAHYR